MLDEEGRLMVLRSLLAKKRDELKLFRASARLTGFAQHLSAALRELQRHQLTPESLSQLAEEVRAVERLSFKLHDLATLLQDYLDWLQAHQLQDADYLLDFATRSLARAASAAGLWANCGWMASRNYRRRNWICSPNCSRSAANATITFCLDRVPHGKNLMALQLGGGPANISKVSKALGGLPNCDLPLNLLPRRINQSRFLNNPVLHHLETHWAAPQPLPIPRMVGLFRQTIVCASRQCANPEAEVTLAAREILRFVRAGGRYREVTVLARNLQSYHEPLANIFARYEIPFFLDRRESVSHHPLAELSRNALRTVRF